MNDKVYKRLMIAGLVPWRGDVLKKTKRIVADEEKLLKDGWKYVNITKTLKWRNDVWRLLYKIVSDAKKLPDFDFPTGVAKDIRGVEVLTYKYVEFQAVNLITSRSTLYAYGNFLSGHNIPYIMKGRQLVKLL